MRKENHPRGWNEIKTNDSWAIFKIMGEFVSGYEKLSRIGPCVSIFGSARTKPDNPYYQLAERIAQKIVDNGYGVITGGGPGIMEAGNKGAHLAGGTSVGLNIELPFEQHDNPYIDSDKNLDFDFAPPTREIFDFGKLKYRERNCIIALLAFPLTGGALI